MVSGSPVEAVRRAFLLLEELNRQQINSVQHLHDATKLPKSTIVRLLDTLRVLGYVANNSRSGGYQVTSGVRALNAGFHGDPLVVEAARPWMIEFTRQLKVPIGVAVFDKDAMVVRFSTTRESPFSPFHATVNMRLAIFTRAIGRAYFAYCSADEQQFILRVLKASKRSEDRLAQDPDEVRALVQRIRRNGFAERSPEVEPKSSNTFGVPITDNGKVLAAIGVSYFVSTMPRKIAIDTYVPPLIELAHKIEASIASLASLSVD